MLAMQKQNSCYLQNVNQHTSEVIALNARQEAYQMISLMPEEGVQHLVEFLKNMGVKPFTKHDVTRNSMRIGAGVGTIVDTPNFDKYDAEIAALFEGESL